tara:strand:+ start:807 stop:1916 length:1110 start_codon:yes stop_codon:yes gene_type:complete
VSIAKAAKKLTVNASNSTGLNSETNDGSQGAFLITVSAQKLLEDNGQADRSILLSELIAESAILEAQIDVDQTLQKILDAYTSQNTASKVDGIIDHYVGMFNEYENRVKAAVKVGVLSNSDYLELQSLKNETLSEQAQALLRFKSAQSFLKTSLKTHLGASDAELAAKYSLLELPPLLFEKAYAKEMLDLKSVQIKTEIEIEETLKKPVVNWQTSVSSPKSRGAGSTLFTGVTIGMPLKDGGKAAAKIEALLKELDVIVLETDTLKQKTILANERLSNFLDYYHKQNSLLLERKKISEERIEELELKIKAGRSDISVLAKQFLTNARTEIALEQLNYERSSEILAAVAVTGQTCELLDICDAIIARIAK